MRSKDHVTVKFYQSHKHRQHGFSLMELMTVVVIVGVLSAMAIPTFSDYVYKSRATEASEFLGVIRLREESYRAEFGAYCPTLAAAAFPTALTSLNTKSNLVPDPSTTGRNSTLWAPTATWRQLGASPSGPIRFGYGVVDGTYVMFETYSANKGIYIGNYPTGGPIAKGWE
jgi:prepilin-type N-terminal cleavage/methylation domain-containing protein